MTARIAQRARRRDARCCPRPTTGCARGSRPPAGEFPFQEWFVARGHRDEVDALRFEGAEAATPAPGVLEAIDAADLLLIAPSNPYVSIAPILAVPAIRAALEHAPRAVRRGQPADRRARGRRARPTACCARLAGGTSPAHVADCYAGLIDALVVDEADADDVDGLGAVRAIVDAHADAGADARRRLAEAALGAGARVKIAVVGGTGDFGLALAQQLVGAGHDVVVGSRDAERAAEKAARDRRDRRGERAMRCAAPTSSCSP